MTYPAILAHPETGAAPGLILRIWRRLLGARRRHLDRVWLQELDDHILRDIGVHRGDIADAIGRGRDGL